MLQGIAGYRIPLKNSITQTYTLHHTSTTKTCTGIYIYIYIYTLHHHTRLSVRKVYWTLRDFRGSVLSGLQQGLGIEV